MQIYQFKYVKQFHCDGNKCNTKCCKNWVVDIDKNTYKKYLKIKDIKIRDRILDNIVKQKNDNGYMISFNDKKECPFISNDAHCFVHQTVGAAAIPIACQIYPRNLLVLGDCQLRSLSMTCPIAAEIALFSDDGMEMDCYNNTAEYNNNWNLLLRNIKTEKSLDGSIVESTIVGGISILQNDSLTREERLILLGLFLDKSDDLKINKTAGQQILHLASMYKDENFLTETKNLFSKFIFSSDDNKKFMASLLSMVADNNQIGALHNLLKQAEDYVLDYDKWQVRLDNEYSKAIDNYWVQEFFYHGYPFCLKGNFLHNYFVYLLSYKVWEIVLYGYLHVLGRMVTKDEFINLVGTYSKIIDHKKDFLSVLERKASECEIEPIQAMQMLLRLK